MKNPTSPRSRRTIRSALPCLVLLLAAAAPAQSRESPGGAAPPASPSAAARILVIGASASEGFGLPVKMADALAARLDPEKATVQSESSNAFFMMAETVGRSQIASVLRTDAAAVVAIDFLFWYAYGTRPEDQRMAFLEKGLEQLDRLKVPTIAATIPDMREAIGLMLRANQVPAPETIAAMNRRIEDWAAGRPHITLLPLPDLLDRMRRRVDPGIEGLPWTPEDMPDLLQRDRLHPNVPGLGALAHMILEAVRKRDGLLPEGALIRNLEQGIAELEARARTARGGSEPAPEPPPPAPDIPRPPVESGFFTTSDGVKLHYLESGSGPAIVFVPGWTMPAEIWKEQIRGFSTRYRVVALDPRSQGRSEKSSEGHFPERRAKDIFELVQHLELAPATLVGWSLAVPELLTYVDQFGTGTIHALALVDGFIGADRDPSKPDPMRGMLRAMHTDRKTHAKAFVKSMFKKEQSEEYIDWLTGQSLLTPTNSAFALLGHLMTIDADWRPVLDKLDRPVIYFASGQMAGQARMLEARVPGSRIAIFHDAGHALFVEEPEFFNGVLRGFIHSLDHPDASPSPRPRPEARK